MGGVVVQGSAESKINGAFFDGGQTPDVGEAIGILVKVLAALAKIFQ